MLRILFLLSGVLLAAGVMDRYSPAWNYLYIKDAIRGEDCPEMLQTMNKCWIDYITAGRDKKKMQLFLCVLLNKSGGNPGRH